jgi:ABC-type transport system involved in multi-copper enzyme maturation permease subunit
MNRGILLKAARELWPITLLLGIAHCVAQGVLSFVLPTFARELTNQVIKFPFLQNIIRGLIGSDFYGAYGPELFYSIAWVHPVVLAITWAHAIVVTTRVPAGEVDRGTIDVLLGLPVARWNLFISETLVWLGSGAVLLAFGALGNWIGTERTSEIFHPQLSRVLIVLLNQFGLYVAVGAMGWLASAMSDRRGRAMGAVFAIVLASFLLNYLAQFWEPARRLSFLGMLQYFRPIFILKEGTVPWKDMGVLFGLAVVLWTGAGVAFARRDLSTI